MNRYPLILMIFDDHLPLKTIGWRLFGLVLSLTLLLCLTPQGFVHSTETDIDFEPVRSAYQKARKGEGVVVIEALERVEQFLKARPTDPVAQMYKGSLLTMRSRDSFLPWTKLRYVDEGVELMDEAMARKNTATAYHSFDPQLEMLLVRGFTNANLPARFNRSGLAREDLGNVHRHQHFSKLSADTQAAVWAWLARFAKEDGDNRAAENLLSKARTKDSSTTAEIWNRP